MSTIQEKLALLGNTPDEIALSLISIGIKARPLTSNDPTNKEGMICYNCPLAVYLQQYFPDTAVGASSYWTFKDTGEREALTYAQRTFVHRHDACEYPELRP